jgi:hypothetical protein
VLGRSQRMLAGSDHPTGLAIDLFIGRNKTLGDQIASCAARNFDNWNETEGDRYAARNPDPARVDRRRPL